MLHAGGTWTRGRRLQWVLVILRTKPSNMEIKLTSGGWEKKTSNKTKPQPNQRQTSKPKPYTDIQHKEICSRPISPMPEERPRVAVGPCLGTYRHQGIRDGQTSHPFPHSRPLAQRAISITPAWLKPPPLSQFERQLSPLASPVPCPGRRGEGGELRHLQRCIFAANCLSMTSWLIHIMRSRGANIM